MSRLKGRMLIGLVTAVALVWGASPGLRATAKTAAKATAKAATAAATKVATAAAQAGKSKSQNQTGTACTINGKTLNPCPPGLLKQAKRQAARQNAPRQQTGVAVQIAGVSPATSAVSPLAQVGSGPTTLAFTPAVAGPPDYFGAANYANSPLPVVSNGTLSGGLLKFQDALPGFCSVTGPTATLGQCIPLAVPNTTLFPGSDYYQIGIGEYTQKMHSNLPNPTHLRGYIDLGAVGATHQYLGPLILATRNRPVRLLFTNQLALPLNTPVDTTYMGAGAVNDGTHSVATTSEKRSVIHLHGGNTPWISDGTPHQWITPAGGDGQPLFDGFAKGFSFSNVPDMVPPACVGAQCVIASPSVSDGQGTDFWTNLQSGRLMFYHEHAYGVTRLGVYNGLAAGYLLVDGAQEAALAAATVPGTIPTINDPSGALDVFGNPSQIPNLAAADLTHLYPLVIQDKTFVPDAGTAGGQLAAEDPTWDLSRGGAGDLWFPHVYTPNQNPADLSGANGFGRWDWGPWFFPPQNQSSLIAQGWPCTSAATPTAGWAFPPLQCPGVPFQGASAVPAAVTAHVPDSPSGTPEAFMDTPVVNGTAYPTLTVAPAAYRFQVLNAANDRTLNLGLYVAEPVTLSVIITNPGNNYTNPTFLFSCAGATATGTVGSGTFGGVAFTNGVTSVDMTTQPAAGCTNPTVTIGDTAPGVGSGALASVVMSTNSDVRMVPNVPVAARPAALPNCSTSQEPVMWGGGQVTALLDGTGNPLNGTGLPANCWPLYNSTAGFTAGPMGEKGALSWGNSDGRIGGIPDPTFAGPPIVQLAAEGGLLPQAVVIPSTPISYDYNKRSITVLNVLNHGLLIGPAERADIVVDFSGAPAMCAAKGVSPCTLILYNDAPAPVPGADPRLDYFTNDPDQTSTGGAPTTMAGYGPNIRTIMQIQVTGSNPNTTTFSVPTLMANMPTLFAATQDMPIVQEPEYPVGHGNGPATYIPISATSINAWVGGPVGGLTLTSGGAGYTAPPSVSIAPPPTGTPATATANLAATSVGSITLTAGGSGYTSAPTVTISGNGTGATATATLATRSVGSVTVTKSGSGYTSVPTVTFSAPPAGTTATGTAVVVSRKVTSITITNKGTGYITAPTISITGGGGSGAAATATLAPAAVASLTLTNGGSGFTLAPGVSFSGGGGSGAAATTSLTPTVVASLTLNNAGSGYTGVPAVTIAAPQTAGSTATAVAVAPVVPLQPKTIQELFTLDYGRMNATLGVEVPFTNFLTQTTIPYGYVDPPTEMFRDGETQLWKITHNGVDTHFIHVHLFTAQVINRVGWDGAIKPPDPNEVGLKDTIRMNPLEDVIIAVRTNKQPVPFAVPTSYRPMDVTMPVGSSALNEFTNVDPTNQPATVTNTKINFGWEYVWHCHILGHEENDMMRAMILAVAPAVPSVTAATGGSKGTITLAITDAAATANVADPTGFTIYRATSQAGPFTAVGTVAPTIAGTSATATFTDTGLTSKATYVYYVVANNLVGYTQVYAAPAAGYPNISADSAASAKASAIAR